LMMKRTPIVLKPPRRSMPLQKNAAPELFPAEEVILETQGGYRERHRRGWQPVQLFLTTQRLICYRRPQIKFQIGIDRVRNLTDERHYYVLKERDAICIAYEGIAGSRAGRILLIVNRSSEWKEKLRQLCLLKIDQSTIQQLSDHLDTEGRDILWHLWEHRHARINRLADVIDARDHLHVLSLITETINPISQKMLGCPILSFERRRVDPESGETVTFSWWLIGQKASLLPSEERLVDIFEEGETIRVIMEVRGVDTRDLKLDITGDQVLVRCHKLGASLRVKLDLPHAVTPHDYALSIKNGFLEMRLKKVRSPMTTE
jgi:HSP20 family molecular chaperone IbpA